MKSLVIGLGIGNLYKSILEGMGSVVVTDEVVGVINKALGK